MHNFSFHRHVCVSQCFFCLLLFLKTEFARARASLTLAPRRARSWLSFEYVNKTWKFQWISFFFFGLWVQRKLLWETNFTKFHAKIREITVFTARELLPISKRVPEKSVITGKIWICPYRCWKLCENFWINFGQKITWKQLQDKRQSLHLVWWLPRCVSCAWAINLLARMGLK